MRSSPRATDFGPRQPAFPATAAWVSVVAACTAVATALDQRHDLIDTLRREEAGTRGISGTSRTPST